jgi:hypothetical protein
MLSHSLLCSIPKAHVSREVNMLMAMGKSLLGMSEIIR